MQNTALSIATKRLDKGSVNCKTQFNASLDYSIKPYLFRKQTTFRCSFLANDFN